MEGDQVGQVSYLLILALHRRELVSFPVRHELLVVPVDGHVVHQIGIDVVREPEDVACLGQHQLERRPDRPYATNQKQIPSLILVIAVLYFVDVVIDILKCQNVLRF